MPKYQKQNKLIHVKYTLKPGKVYITFFFFYVHVFICMLYMYVGPPMCVAVHACGGLKWMLTLILSSSSPSSQRLVSSLKLELTDTASLTGCIACSGHPCLCLQHLHGAWGFELSSLQLQKNPLPFLFHVTTQTSTQPLKFFNDIQFNL